MSFWLIVYFIVLVVCGVGFFVFKPSIKKAFAKLKFGGMSSGGGVSKEDLARRFRNEANLVREKTRLVKAQKELEKVKRSGKGKGDDSFLGVGGGVE